MLCQRIPLFAAALLLLTGCAATPRAQFGDPPKYPHDDPLSVSRVLLNPERYEGRYIRVAGRVAALCESSGCWVELTDAEAAADSPRLFVWFTYDRAAGGRVPPAAIGHDAIVEGTWKPMEIPEAQRRHLAAERGATPEEVAAIVGPEKSWQLESPHASIVGIEPAKPAPCPDEHP